MVVNTQNTNDAVARRAGREPRVPAAEPPARLPDLRPGRRVPAAGPGARVRARRQPVRGGEAGLPQAAPALAAREPRPRALRAVRAVHAVLRPDLGRPLHRAVRARGRGARLDRGGRGLPRRRSAGTRSRSVRSVPSPPTPYRFVARPFDLSTVDSVCPHCSAGCNLKVDVRRGEVVRAARARQPRRERRLALRQGAVRVPVPRRSRPHHDAADPRPRAGARVVRRGPHADRRVDRGRARRVPHRRPPDGRGLLRAVEARAHGVPHERPRPPPGRRRRAGRGARGGGEPDGR